MAAAALIRWIVLRLLRSPGLALLGVAFLLGVPLLCQLTPLPSRRTGLDLALAWAFPAGLVGISLALATLARGSEFLQRLDPWTRTLGEWGALAAGAIYMQLPILGGALLSQAPLVDLGRTLPAILTADLLLGSVALLTLIPALPIALRTGLFLAAVWALPALVTGNGTLAPFLAWLDARATLRATDGIDALRALSAAAAFTLATLLLRTAPARATSG
jgi:hypothetical protein